MNNKEILLDLLSSSEPLEPETLKQLFPEYTDIELETVLMYKVIKNTIFVFEDMNVFENCVHLLNNVKPNITRIEGALPHQIWYALLYINKIKDYPYSNEIKEYIKWNFKEAGLNFLPPDAGFTEEENPNFEKVQTLALNGPFPLQETALGIQASKYLKILAYLEDKQ